MVKSVGIEIYEGSGGDGADSEGSMREAVFREALVVWLSVNTP